MYVRLLAVACCAALLVSCDLVGGDPDAAPETTAVVSPSGSPPTAPTGTPTATGQASPTASAAAEDDGRVVSHGIRLDRLETDGARTVARLTNLNDLPVQVDVVIDVHTGGDVPTYRLRGSTSLVDASDVLLVEQRGQSVSCPDVCSYTLRAQVTETGGELGTNETTCTPDVCDFGSPTPTPTPTPDSAATPTGSPARTPGIATTPASAASR